MPRPPVEHTSSAGGMEEVRLYWEVEFERQGYAYTPTETIL